MIELFSGMSYEEEDTRMACVIEFFSGMLWFRNIPSIFIQEHPVNFHSGTSRPFSFRNIPSIFIRY